MNPKPNTVIGSLAIRYSESPGIKALLQLIPNWGSVDVLLQARADQIKQQRLCYFFDSIASGNIQLTEEIIQSEEFLHCFFKTTQAVINTQRKEKIQLFGRMLVAATDSHIFTGLDQYEELLDALDSMSFREFGVLHMLRGYEIAFKEKVYGNDLARIHDYWTQFLSLACSTFDIEESEIEAFLERLQRTGFYVRNMDAMWDTQHIGKTTRQFDKLCGLVSGDVSVTKRGKN